MNLTLNNNGYLPGVYINEVKILSIKDLSGKPTYNGNEDSVYDLAIEVECDISKEWNKKVILKGNLNEDNARNGWGSAFIVKDFFQKTGCFSGLTEDEIQDRLKIFGNKEVPADFLAKPVGRVIYTLDYIRDITEDGKRKYSTWNRISNEPDKLHEEFKYSLTKGYPTNYHPELLNRPTESVPVDGPDEDFVI